MNLSSSAVFIDFATEDCSSTLSGKSQITPWLSAQIQRERKDYYDVLEKSLALLQHGSRVAGCFTHGPTAIFSIQPAWLGSFLWIIPGFGPWRVL